MFSDKKFKNNFIKKKNVKFKCSVVKLANRTSWLSAPRYVFKALTMLYFKYYYVGRYRRVDFVLRYNYDAPESQGRLKETDVTSPWYYSIRSSITIFSWTLFNLVRNSVPVLLY